jgi:ubiquinone biosynthesis protein UbiJ
MILNHLIERDPTINSLENEMRSKFLEVRGEETSTPLKYSIKEISVDDAIKELINMQKKV